MFKPHTDAKRMGRLSLFSCLGIALLGSSLLVAVQAGPLRPLRVVEHDPLMALPSDQHAPQEVQYVAYQQVVAAGPQQPERHEMVVEYQPQEQQQSALGNEQPQPAGAPYQTIQVVAQQQHYTPGEANVPTDIGPDCRQRLEYTSMFSLESPAGAQTGEQQQQQQPPPQQYAPTSESERPRNEYPGEIIYLGQGGSTPGGLRQVAAVATQNSDVSATILTEIPVRDMPPEVLSKLKREYGVKVVATRERPGANLVINCDDYPNQEGSVCGRHAQTQSSSQAEGRQAQPAHPPSYVYSHTLEPATHAVELPAEHQGHRTSFHIEHEVQPTSEPANVYVTHETQEGPSEPPALAELAYQQPQAPPAAGQANEPTAAPSAEEQPNNEGANYGTRTSTPGGGGGGAEQQAGGETHEAGRPAAVEQSGHQEGSSATGEQYQPGASAEAADQNVGFDEQPKSGEP